MQHHEINGKKQILLCGTQYGQTYLPGIFASPDLELAAIVAQGSPRSIKIAEQAGVDLILKVEDIQQSPDCALVAVGGDAGFHLANELLTRKIPVLIEHPINEQHIKMLCDVAQINQTPIHINGHFALLPPIDEFIQLGRQLHATSHPLFIQIACNSRTLFSMLDIVQRVWGEQEIAITHHSNLGGKRHYYHAEFSIGETPCIMLYQAWRNTTDDSTDSPLGHHITVTYPQGVLILSSTFGPCLWFPLLAAGMPANAPAFGSALQSTLFNLPIPRLQNIIEWRQAANVSAIYNLLRAANTSRELDSQTPAYLISLCRNWSRLFSLLPVDSLTSEATMLARDYWSAQAILNKS